MSPHIVFKLRNILGDFFWRSRRGEEHREVSILLIVLEFVKCQNKECQRWEDMNGEVEYDWLWEVTS